MTTDVPVHKPVPGSVDIDVKVPVRGVAVIEIRRPPNNFFDAALISLIADIAHTLASDNDTRAIVVASQGKNFCAGADFNSVSGAAQISADEGARELYSAAARLFASELPLVAAVQGAAVGGGMGLALAADFRVAGPRSRFAANFSRIGLHHGFGMTVTMPRIVGTQYATDLLLTGRNIDGAEAFRVGLVDRLVDDDAIRDSAILLATELATTAPLALRSIRKTLRRGLAEAVATATDHERAEQAWLRATNDFAEGVRASADRRTPTFIGR
ncbi:enoyl-CoA hydratase/isomerase family protein [Mycobacterium vicinigordonae]|uniref:Enoyl-CoA hydratase/isomerase family protein n=1 Tax=Mycobacterium vicinigordonae TaxID=1719132 RepID=A0A7D6I5Q0_9MYCO|nr:enoyl-CoA hydratase/isomerase family protein [Mycobacterium vicinigordonae]QLL07578.1 enoyl-CoA hydratase/isomerase family protein [Mycobacterium vicinigordonae]